METELPKTFQMRFDLNNEQDQKIAHFLQTYPWSRTQKVKEILLAYIENQELSKQESPIQFMNKD